MKEGDKAEEMKAIRVGLLTLRRAQLKGWKLNFRAVTRVEPC